MEAILPLWVSVIILFSKESGSNILILVNNICRCLRIYVFPKQDYGSHRLPVSIFFSYVLVKEFFFFRKIEYNTTLAPLNMSSDFPDQPSENVVTYLQLEASNI